MFPPCLGLNGCSLAVSHSAAMTSMLARRADAPTRNQPGNAVRITKSCAGQEEAAMGWFADVQEDARFAR